MPGDPSSEDPDFGTYCTHCGNALREGDWHPVVTDTEDGTIVALYSFCDEECKRSWETES